MTAKTKTPARERLPATRPGVTTHIEMATADGLLDCYVTANRYADGRPGELFLTVKGAGASLYAGFADAFASTLSIALQHGVPLSIVTGKLRGTHAQPTGRVGQNLNASLLDVIARWLDEQFPGSA